MSEYDHETRTRVSEWARAHNWGTNANKTPPAAGNIPAEWSDASKLSRAAIATKIRTSTAALTAAQYDVTTITIVVTLLYEEEMLDVDQTPAGVAAAAAHMKTASLRSLADIYATYKKNIGTGAGRLKSFLDSFQMCQK